MSSSSERGQAAAWIMGGTAAILFLIGWAAAPSWERDHLGDVLVGVFGIAVLAVLVVVGATVWVVQSWRDGERPRSAAGNRVEVHHHHERRTVVVVMDPTTGGFRELAAGEARMLDAGDVGGGVV